MKTMSSLDHHSAHSPIAPPAPHKDFSELYERMSGKGESASEAHPRPAAAAQSTLTD